MKAMLLMLGVTLAVTAGFADEAANPTAALAPLIGHVAKHRDGKAPNSIDFAALEGDRSQLPIGVFDSGIGGLTVLEAILKLDAFNNATLQPGADGVPDFTGEKFLYLGDQANMPYGNYPSKGREDYLRELIVKDAVFLLGRRYHGADGVRFDKPPVKAIVIACNTATAYGIEDIRAALKAWSLDVPVIGVVEAGARAVVEQLPSEGKAPTVGVLATVGTCASNAYLKAIARAAGLAGKPVPLVVQQGSVGLAGAIEGNPAFVWKGAGERPVPYAGPDAKTALMMFGVFGVPGPLEQHILGFKPGASDTSAKSWALNTVAAYAHHDTARLVVAAKQTMGTEGTPLSMVVLGCTHFPLAEAEIETGLRRARNSVKKKRDGTAEKLFEMTVAEQVVFINPAEHTAKDLFRTLARAKLRNTPTESAGGVPECEFFLSVPNPAADGVKLAADGSLNPDYKHGREAGQPRREDTKDVPMTPQTLPPSSSALLEKLPTVWVQMQGSGAQSPKQP